ncbi:MAG: ribonuclease R [Bdellovibrionaceae bacterium]|nr:ribonuclease R [Pseudobdellovibrionaceae bacterium]
MKQIQAKQIEGILKRHPDGFGFVIPDDKNHPDIYIPSTKIGSALTNDRVEVLVYKKKRGSTNAYFGFIQNILKRNKEYVVGTVEIKNNQVFIINHNLSFFHAISLSNPKKILFKKGDYVKAKIKFPNIKSLKKKTRFLKQDFFFKADLSENLGSISDSAKDDVKRIMSEYDIPFDFPSVVLKSANQLPENVRKKDYFDRKDLRQKAFVTIDGATAQDFDDAIFVERHKAFYRLYVAIADVSYYVKEDSELDRSALERGNSSYFPNFCSPMLPEKLSNDLCSLKEGEDRLVMVQEMDFDFQGEMKSSSLYSAVIKSHKRLNYGQTQEILDQFFNVKEFPEKESDSKTDYFESLKQAQKLAQILIQKHIKELGFDLEIPETLIVLDQYGEPQDILKEQRLFSHKMIEHFMLSANKAVSAFLEKKQMPLIYRIHESPDPDKLKILQKFSKVLGFSKSLSSRKNFIQFLNQHKNHEKSSLLYKLTLRSMAQARYSAFNKGHYGLNFKSYTHFTSPIRRYCDLQIHRLIKKALGEGKAQNNLNIKFQVKKKLKLSTKDSVKNYFIKELDKQASFISSREQNSVKAERKIKDIKSARFLKKYIGENLKGSVSSITNFGLFISLNTFFVEGLVRYQDMKGFWEIDEFQIYAKNKRSGYLIQLGDEVEVLVTACNVQTGQIDLQLLSHKGKVFNFV